MACCTPYEFPFSNVAFSSIPYTDDMKANLGPMPKIEVYYWDDLAQEYYLLNGIPSSQIKFTGNTVEVDHGGLNTGFVKVS